jgi:hypothetical protein
MSAGPLFPQMERVRRYTVRPGFAGRAWTHLVLHELRDREIHHAAATGADRRHRTEA